jgi:hypothetical protein
MFSRSVSSSVVLALVIGAAMVPSSAMAQASDSIAIQATIVVPAAATADTASVTPASGARLAPVGATKKLQLAPVALETSHSMAAGENVGRNKAMMGVGLAAVVVGLLIGSDIGMLFVIGGALVGLVGLFRYMQ